MTKNTPADATTELHPTLLDRLPTELLDMAAGNIDKFDMLTHVNLCRVSQRVHAIYDARHDDEFWRIQCFMNGISYVQSRDISPTSVSWKQIAFEAAEHADSCDGVCCGRIQLEKNRKNMEMWVKTLPTQGSVLHPIDKHVDGENDTDMHITMFEFITFRPSCIVDDYTKPTRLLEDPQDRPYLEHFRPVKQGVEHRPEPLFDHPVAFRSFAVCPPIRTLCFEGWGFELPDVQNEHGVTIADMCQTIMSESDVGLNVITIERMFPWKEGETNHGLDVPGWSFRDHIHHLAFGTLGGWFRALKCKGFTLYLELPDVDLFTFVFERRDLPRKFSEFEEDIWSTSRYESEGLSSQSSPE